MNIPEPSDKLTGTDWMLQVAKLDGRDRESFLLKAYLAGYVPSFMRTPIKLHLVEGTHEASMDVLPDYLCLGMDDDYIRTPMCPGTAQKIADAWGCVLPTRKIVNEVWDQASVRLQPLPMPAGDPTRPMTGSRMFVAHNQRIYLQLVEHGAPGPLVAGHKKDVVLSPKLDAHHVAIYGWHQLTGLPIQGLNCTSHSADYCDYSHGIRLLDANVTLGDSMMHFEDALKDGVLSKLVSDEGPSLVWRQPGV